MGDTTLISWTDMTFNPWIGCTKVSAGCTNCYAERDNKRYGWVDQWGPQGTRRRTSAANWKKPLAWDRQAKKDGVRKKVFCASLADVFEDRPELENWRCDLWNLISATPNLDWLLLTKRPENVVPMWLSGLYRGMKLTNAWIGTTAENQAMADLRIPELLKIPAAVRFLSVEPMLGPVNLGLLGTVPKDISPQYTLVSNMINWVICGGESGPAARPMSTRWALDLRDQCQTANVSFFFKQIGGWPDTRHGLTDFPESLRVREFPR